MGEPHDEQQNHIVICIASLKDLIPISPTERRNIYGKLHLAALKGDWETAKKYYNQYGGQISYNSQITKRNETILHIAVTTDKVNFVKHIVKMMSNEDLAMEDNAGNTAFFLAALAGKVECAKVMMKRKPDLAMKRGGSGDLPLYMAASRGYSKMAKWLYIKTKSELAVAVEDKINIFVALICSNIYDVALKMLKDDRSLATGRDSNRETALHALAQKLSLTIDVSPPDEPTEKITWKSCTSRNPLKRYKNYTDKKRLMREKIFELVRGILDEVVKLDDSEISDLIEDPWPLIFMAAKRGNVEFLIIFIDSYPDLIFKVDDMKYTIFHIAVLHRQEDVFRLIHEFYSVKERITIYRDSEGNNMLHLAAKLPLTANRLHVVSGAALQLQRELLWFKEVEKVVPRMSLLEAKNGKGLTPQDLFVASHENLLKEGEGWMRGTADKCMLVATLIATVVFAAAFTVPGGNTQDTGIPIFLRNAAFKCFFLADGVSLVSSVASVMIFLGIMTSRYQLDDFYLSLPRKLTIGLGMLFISLVAMLMAFVAATFLVFNHGNGLVWFAIPLTVIGSVPVIFFVWTYTRLFMDVCVQTFNSESIFKPNEVPISVQATEKVIGRSTITVSKVISRILFSLIYIICPLLRWVTVFVSLVGILLMIIGLVVTKLL